MDNLLIAFGEAFTWSLEAICYGLLGTLIGFLGGFALGQLVTIMRR